MRGTPVHLDSSRRGEGETTVLAILDQGVEGGSSIAEQNRTRTRAAQRTRSVVELIVERIMKKENRDKARLENADVYGNDKRWRLAG